MSGLFSTFNISKRGLNVAQTTIDVTSHNIANANTEGYSRQRAEIVTTTPFGGNSRI
jgi:flagellar hook-associated protein 1 FlgK